MKGSENLPKLKPKHGFWRRAGNVAIVVLTVCASLGLVLTAYAERVSPVAWPKIVIVTMTLPAWVLATAVMFVLDLIWWRRTAWIAGLAMLACIGQIHQFCPLNFPHLRMSQEKKERSFTLMTYNVYGMQDFREHDLDYNRQLAYILQKNSDIVCLQEALYLAPTPQNHITQAQLDSLHTLYPYVMTQGENFALLSKYPAQSISLDFPTKDFRSGDMAAWRLDVKGELINIFSVHLRSLYLTPDDKSAYQDIIELDSLSRSDLHDAKAFIIPKISEAAVERAEQVQYLQKYLAKYGGKNAIVCGDFNDTVGCYGLYLLTHESHMKQAYAHAGFGPMITYNANDLYFHIDHLLYRGNMYPWKVSRGSILASDHYPVLATFVLKK